MRDVCYCLTHNLYEKVIPSLKSLFANGNISRVYIVAEDDSLGVTVPDRVSVVNVKNQKWFPWDGPNIGNVWTYMSLMRMALCHVFPDKEKILSLDHDTIIREDLSELWNIDLSGAYATAVEEPNRSPVPGRYYVNCGAVLWNLDLMRKGKADEIIQKLNTKWYEFGEQDAFNESHENRVHLLPAQWNTSHWTGMPWNWKIRHYAAENNWWNEPLVQEWNQKEWTC